MDGASVWSGGEVKREPALAERVLGGQAAEVSPVGTAGSQGHGSGPLDFGEELHTVRLSGCDGYLSHDAAIRRVMFLYWSPSSAPLLGGQVVCNSSPLATSLFSNQRGPKPLSPKEHIQKSSLGLSLILRCFGSLHSLVPAMAGHGLGAA